MCPNTTRMPGQWSFRLVDETGSGLLEFILIYPLALGIFAMSFTQLHAEQLREFGVTAIAQEVARGVEIGRTPREIAAQVRFLSKQVGFHREPQLQLEAISENRGLLTVSYRNASYSIGFTTTRTSALWRQISDSDRGSMLPLFACFLGITGALLCVILNLTAAEIADYRAFNVASRIALEAAIHPGNLDNARTMSELESLPQEQVNQVSIELSAPDLKTVEARVCYRYSLIFDLWPHEQLSACAVRSARVIAR